MLAYNYIPYMDPSWVTWRLGAEKSQIFDIFIGFCSLENLVCT